MSDELRQRAVTLIETIDRKLPQWRAWFPNENSEVYVPRCDLLALKYFAEVGLEALDVELNTQPKEPK